MAKFLAKEIKVEIDTDGLGTLAEIKELTSFEHNPATDRVDLTDFDSTDGRKESTVVFRGDTFVLQGKAEPDDDGQIAVAAVAALQGDDAVAAYKISAGGKTYDFSATAEVKLFGGGLTDGATWQATLEVTGVLTPGVVTP